MTLYRFLTGRRSLMSLLFGAKVDRLLRGGKKRAKKSAGSKNYFVRLSRLDHKHGLDEFIPGTKTKLLSDQKKKTAIYEKGRASLTSADMYLINHLRTKYGSNPFPRGYLDAGRVSRILGRELMPVDQSKFDPYSQYTMLCMVMPDETDVS